MREYFFGKKGNVNSTIIKLKKEKRFSNKQIDISDKKEIDKLFKNLKNINAIIHTAAQPSHDWAVKEPITDFKINANGTLILLESFRKYHPKATFIFTSTNKVYGDKPNEAKLIEKSKRFEFNKNQKLIGISKEFGVSEKLTIDNSKHSIFGASKLAADILCQEYGKYFNLNIGIFRGGCLTGPQHKSVELHGFLSYIIKCAIHGQKYNIFGYKGKQVRDQMHSFDVANIFWEFIKKPKQGEVYNIGGGKKNSISILEIIDILKQKYGIKLNFNYSNKPRIGDHVCYYTDMRKFKGDYPNWKLTKSIPEIIDEIVKKEINDDKN